VQDGSARSLGSPRNDGSANGAYWPQQSLMQLWNEYRADTLIEQLNSTFGDALRLLEAQGWVFADSGLVYLSPAFVVDVVKPLVDHRLTVDKAESNETKQDLALRPSEFTPDDVEHCALELKQFVLHGVLTRLVLRYLWRDLQLDAAHYDQVLSMLADAGIVAFLLKSEDEDDSTIAVVPYRLPSLPGEDAWPTRARDERELEMTVGFLTACPPGLIERYAARCRRHGVVKHAWRFGVVVRRERHDRETYRLRAGLLDPGNASNAWRLVFTIRFVEGGSNAAWDMLRDAVSFLREEQRSRYPGLGFSVALTCPKADCRERIPWRRGGTLTCMNTTCRCKLEAESPDRGTASSETSTTVDVPVALENGIPSVVAADVKHAALRAARYVAERGVGEKTAADGFTFILGASNIILAFREHLEFDDKELTTRTRTGRFSSCLDYRGKGVNIKTWMKGAARREFLNACSRDGAVVIDGVTGEVCCGGFFVANVADGEAGGGARTAAASAIATQAGGCFVIMASHDICHSNPTASDNFRVYDRVNTPHDVPVLVEEQE